jgi:nucleotide-binding universal stress UspA family protein
VLRRILIGLGGMAGTRTALELGLRWAKLYSAQLVGLDIADNPGTQAKERAKFRLDEPGQDHTSTDHPLLEWFARQSKQAGVDSVGRVAAGAPHLEILSEAQRHDLILLGQRSHFESGMQGVPGETLAKVLPSCPRPVVIVPSVELEGDAVVIAYDGSLQAARVLHAFETTGLGAARAVHVVTIHHERNEGSRIADRAIDFLSVHGISAIPHVKETAVAPAEVIRATVKETSAGLLVMGVYGQPILREFLIGSVTRSVLKACPAPLFVYH